MRSVWITRTGPPEALEVRDGPDPVPGPGQALVRVRATGVNFADVMARLGLYPDAPPRPCVVGYEVAGTVERLGAGAEVIGTASAAKHAQLREAGVAHAIDYRTQDFEAEVRRVTGGRGVDIVLDATEIG